MSAETPVALVRSLVSVQERIAASERIVAGLQRAQRPAVEVHRVAGLLADWRDTERGILRRLRELAAQEWEA